MKVKELVRILLSQTNGNNDVYIQSFDNYMTTNIGVSIDDNNDISLYEQAKD